MAKPDPKKEPELHSNAWARFERAVDVVAKRPRQHRTKATKSPKRKNKAPSKRGYAPQQTAFLFDHLVGAREQQR